MVSPVVHRSAPFPSPSNKILLDHQEPQFLFKGWLSPSPEWRHWVEKLSPIYGSSWRNLGIFDAIQASTYELRKDHASIAGVLKLWSGETNTFHFSWAEATITLEDIMILGGFPVLGEPVRDELPLLDVDELTMITERRRVVRGSDKMMADHSSWIKHFMQYNGDIIEHIAFLSLWLSRFVFPALVVRQCVFSIAIRLVRGTRIALAPAVLASVYRDLRSMRKRKHLGNNTTHPLRVWAPMGLLQLWLWERFISLSPEKKNNISSEGPRVARWHGVSKPSEPSFVQSALQSPSQFLCRPYATHTHNGGNPCCYIDKGGWLLNACELVGLDCIEQYLPHRVAMQFGLDQDMMGQRDYEHLQGHTFYKSSETCHRGDPEKLNNMDHVSGLKTARVDRELEDIQIRMLKEEIAAIKAKIKSLESIHVVGTEHILPNISEVYAIAHYLTPVEAA